MTKSREYMRAQQAIVKALIGVYGRKGFGSKYDISDPQISRLISNDDGQFRNWLPYQKFKEQVIDPLRAELNHALQQREQLEQAREVDIVISPDIDEGFMSQIAAVRKAQRVIGMDICKRLDLACLAREEFAIVYKIFKNSGDTLQEFVERMFSDWGELIRE